jgi:hypothetical protein
MPVPADQATNPARRLAAALEPVVGQVYFSPECHAAYERLGFAPSSRKAGDVALPDGPAYFTSRGSLLGQVPGELVASAFAVFNPAVVIPAVTFGWTLTDARTICAERDRGSIAQLRRILGEAPDGLAPVGDALVRATEPLTVEGRPLFAGVRALGFPDDPIGRMWRAGDALREYRGDSHTIAWVSAGLSPVEIGLLTELFWGLPLRSYIRTRAWSAEELDAGVESLSSRGLLDGDGFSAAGRELRESVEHTTDAQMTRAIDALGDDLDAVVDTLTAWSTEIRGVGGYLGGAGDLTRSV